MKYLLILLFIIAAIAGCENRTKEQIALDKKEKDSINEIWHGFHVEVIDSCEYLLRYTERYSGHQGYGQSFMAHKGNCKFCKERRRNEMKDLIK